MNVLWERDYLQLFIFILCFCGTEPAILSAQQLPGEQNRYGHSLPPSLALSANISSPSLSAGTVEFNDTWLTGNTISQKSAKPLTNWTTFAITSSALAGLYTGLFIHEQNHRWNAPRLPFYFNSTLGSKGIDKFGHIYATKSQAELISNLYDFSHINSTKSNLLGAGIALTVQTLIEIKDGKIWGAGFDLYDQTANLLGIAWFYGRENSSFLKQFNIRWFYYPSEEKQFMSSETRFIEDYNGHSYWLSMQLGNVLPHWPRFIVPVAGITLNNWSQKNNQAGYYSYHLSFNLDFTQIIPQRSPWGKLTADLLNGFYIPAPAIEIYPNVSFELLFSIDL